MITIVYCNIKLKILLLFALSLHLNSTVLSNLKSTNSIILSLDKDISVEKPILIENCENIIIDGRGFKIDGYMSNKSIFIITKSKNITLKNISIDYKTVPHLEIDHFSINKKRNTIDIYIDEKTSKKLTELMNIKAKSIYIYPLQGQGIVKKKGTAVTIINNIKRCNRTKYILRFDKIKNNINNNDNLVLVFRNNGNPAIKINNSKNIQLKNVKIFSSPSAAIGLVNSNGFEMNNSKILLKKGQWISSNADGIHCQNSRIGPRISNSIFEGLGDDCINIYTKPIKIIKRTGDKCFLQAGKIPIKKDDRLVFFETTTGKVVKRSRILSITKKDKNRKLICCDFLPQRIIPLQVFDMNLTGSGFIIENNTFRNSRRYGLFLKASDGLIQKNRFEGLGGAAIMMQNITKHFKEGLYCRNITIVDNVFENCGFGKYRRDPCIKIGIRRRDGMSQSPLHRNIVIKNNDLKKCKKMMDISNVSNIRIVQ